MRKILAVLLVLAVSIVNLTAFSEENLMLEETSIQGQMEIVNDSGILNSDLGENVDNVPIEP